MLDLEHFLPYRLSVLSNRISQAIAETYADRFDLTVTEWRVIAILGRYPGISATELGRRSAMDKVSVSRAVRRLLDRGRIRRRDDAGDRRSKLLYLTGAGERIHAEIEPLALEQERRLVEALTESERRALDRVLEKLDGVVDEA